MWPRGRYKEEIRSSLEVKDRRMSIEALGETPSQACGGGGAAQTDHHQPRKSHSVRWLRPLHHFFFGLRLVRRKGTTPVDSASAFRGGAVLVIQSVISSLPTQFTLCELGVRLIPILPFSCGNELSATAYLHVCNHMRSDRCLHSQPFKELSVKLRCVPIAWAAFPVTAVCPFHSPICSQLVLSQPLPASLTRMFLP